MKKIDYSLYLVANRDGITPKKLIDIVLQAVEGGVTIVQLRDKMSSFEEFCHLAKALKEHLRPLKIPLIINDSVEVANAVAAEGVHLGQGDTTIKKARALLGPKAIIGLTVNNFNQGMEAERQDVNYLGAGPIFQTDTKTDCGESWDISDLYQLCRMSSHPVVGIGGINVSNVKQVLECNVGGIAVVSAIQNAANPKSAASELSMLIKKAREYPKEEI